jgi:zinc transport system substrate-binding protein
MLNSDTFRAAGLRAAFFFFIVLPLMLPVAAHGSGGKLKVVASIAPLADFAREVGGGRVDVTLLLPPGASPHTYEPAPKTVLAIAKADVFIRIGEGFEFWADRLVSASNPGVRTVKCSQGLALLRHDGGVDPHIWLDPLICIKIIKKIEEAFSAADKADSSYYRQNAASYIASLSALDREIAERVKTFRTREYVTFHPAWNYFSRRYGLKVAGVIEEGPGKEPSPRHLGRLLADLKRMKTRIIFAEPQFSPKMAEVLAREAGGEVLILDPIGGTDGRRTYIDMMRYNLSVMEKAMK